uniref:Uncharacterized protein LOC102800986 n=1 Tax=Saccoglossus kowalevskii TaxID=10224 RepID=A0ABM0LWT5_SACKO|nr:PREDICTED: uncharacterized protein LOC102800986 [Saccoglossus kowalevskii]
MTNQYGCRWFFIPSLLTIIWFNGQGCQSFPIENGMVKSMENSDVGALLLNLQGNSHGGFSNEDVIAAVLNKTGNPLHRHLLSGDNTRDAAYDLDSEIQSMSTRSSSPWMVLVMLGGCMSVIVVVYAVLIQTSVQKDEVKRKNSCFYRLNMQCMKCFRPSSTDIQQHTNYPVYMVKGIDCFRLGEEGIKSTELKYQTLTCLSEKNDDIYTERRDSGVECYSPTDELKQILNDEMLCTEIRGAFNCQGGMMFSENSDVKLIIPEGALHGEEMRELYVKVFVDVAIFATKMAIDDDSFIMTPIVECGPPGLQFEKPVQLIIPHRVRVHRDAKNIVAKTTSNLFRAFYSNKKLSNMATQNDIPINFIPHMNDACSHKPATSISFNVTGQFVNISTDHFTLFGCIGPRQKHNLHLQTFAYYNNSTDIANNRLLVQYRLYICSPDKDRRKSIEETEKSLGGRLCTPIKPFHLLSHHDVSVEIQLEQIDVWKLRRTPDIDQVIWRQFNFCLSWKQ